MRKPSDITATDQFCGAGGSSQGAEEAGVRLVMALNHWDKAIETHNSNFPHAAHDCTDISACDPRRYPSTNILITSPECFPAGTLILTQRGMIAIEEVVVGDSVLTHTNRWRSVTKTMNTERDTLIVRGQGHRNLETTAKHPFYVRQQTQIWNNSKRDYDRRILDDPTWIHAQNLKNELYRMPLFAD